MTTFQGLLILIAGVLLFGVHWGNLVGVVAVVVLFAAVSSSFALLIGGLLRGPTEQAVLVTNGLLAVLGLLGGCFFALALLPAWLRVVGHLSPHAWAVDALGRLVATNGGIGTILVPLLVLGGVAAGVFVLAVRSMRRSFET